MTPNKNLPVAALEELAFADPSYPWDERAASQRLVESLGWAALAAYSLAVDTAEDSQSFAAYKLLVVDLVDGEPLIVPAALRAARESLDSLQGNMRDTAENNLEYLEARYARMAGLPEPNPEEENEAQVTGEESQEMPADENTTADTGKETLRTERLAEAQALVSGLEAGGSVLPAWGHEALVEFVAGLSTEETLSPDGFERLSPFEYFLRIIRSLPAFVPSGELSTYAVRSEDPMEHLGRRIARSLGNSRQG